MAGEGEQLALDAWIQAAMSEGDWAGPLRQSALALQARAAVVTWTDADANGAVLSVGSRASQAFIRLARGAPARGGRSVCSRIEPGLGHLTWTHVLATGNAPSELGFFLSSDAAVDAAAVREIALVARSAIATRAKLRAERATSALKSTAFDQLPLGMVIVDRRVHIAERNEAFSALLARADGFIVSQDKLVCREASDQAALAGAVIRALSGDLSAAILKVHRVKGAQPYVVRLVAPRGEVSAIEHCLLMFVDPDDEPAPGAEIWRAMFDLTECELIIAEGLVTGRRINDIASERGVSIETVRSQTKRMFERLNVSSQAGAAARLIRAAPFR